MDKAEKCAIMTRTDCFRTDQKREKTMRKRILSFVLCIAVCLSALPGAALYAVIFNDCYIADHSDPIEEYDRWYTAGGRVEYWFK